MTKQAKPAETVEILGFAASTFVRTARMAAEEKGVAYKLAPLNFKSPEHFALHPFGKMPVLRHGQRDLYETAAIAAYLDGAFDGPPLVPADPADRAAMWQWVSVANDYAYPVLVKAALGDGKPDPKEVGQILDILEKAAQSGALSDGNTVTLADLFLMPILSYHADGNADAFENRPHLAAWYERLSARPSFKDTQAV